MADPKKVEYEWMTPDEVVRARAAAPVAYLPIGPLEWHGPHLPLGTDALRSHWVALEAARVTGGVVFPPLFAGSDTVRPSGDGPQGVGALGLDSSERVVGMDLPHNPVKSTYFEEGAFAVTVREYIRAIGQDGFRVIILVNGHGAPNHARALRRLAAEETRLPHLRVELLGAGATEVAPVPRSGHADRRETSHMLAIREEAVKLDKLPPRDVPIRYRDFGIVDADAFDGHPHEGFRVPEFADPRFSTVEEGRKDLEDEVNRVVTRVKQLLEDMPSTQH